MKICIKCISPKELVCFDTRSDSPDGRTGTCKKCRSARARNKYNPKTGLAIRRRTRYGIEPETYEKLLAYQNGKCGVCEKVMTQPFIDHDHKTGKVRGLLCAGCNVRLGFFENQTTEMISKMKAYLRSDAKILKGHLVLKP